jgi:hypothetical protein
MEKSEATNIEDKAMEADKKEGVEGKHNTNS